jgi:hypothetical protein
MVLEQLGYGGLEKRPNVKRSASQTIGAETFIDNGSMQMVEGYFI